MSAPVPRVPSFCAAYDDPGEKRRHYSSAHGSAVESAAVLDLLIARGLAAANECQPVRALLVRVIQMLVKLEQRMAR